MLKLKIGSFEYRVVRAEEALHDAEHGPLWGQCDFVNRRISISPACPNDQLGDVLCHEACHAWLKHAEKPASEESLCNFVGMVAWGLMRDIEKQGGTSVLLTLGMQQRVLAPVASARDLNATDRVDVAGCCCCVCQQAVAPGSVVRGKPVRHPRIGTPVIHLRFYCNYCEALVRWTELVSPGGLPNGMVVDLPEQISGKEADQFCRDHLRETGVLMG
jgi:hypothetical protein